MTKEAIVRLNFLCYFSRHMETSSMSKLPSLTKCEISIRCDSFLQVIEWLFGFSPFSKWINQMYVFKSRFSDAALS